MALLALLILAAGSCAPSPRLSRSSERTSPREKPSRKVVTDEDQAGEPASKEDEAPGSAAETEPSAERIEPTPRAAATREEKAPHAPRDAGAIARRALVLRAVGTVALFPRATEKSSATTMEYFDAKREKLVADLKKEKLWESASKNEQVFLTTPVGVKSEGTPIEAGEVSEALLVALWSLGLVKRLPEFDTPSPGITLLSAALPPPEAAVAEFVNGAQLRPQGEIDHAKLKAFFWNWRAQVHDRIAEGKFLEGEKLDREVQILDANAHAEGFRLGPIRNGRSFYHELIRFSSFHAAKEGLIGGPIREDFPVKGKSFAELTDREIKKIATIAAGRLHALEWIRGDLLRWDSFSERG
jgi:uncharacterized protein DUF4272